MRWFYVLGIFIVVIAYHFIFPHTVFAHFPITEGNITTILHVDPNDSPIPGQQATLYFDILDETNKFNILNCLCTIRIFEDDKQIFQGRLSKTIGGNPSIWGASIPFIFPHRDVYKISLLGIPISSNLFQKFNLSWYFRVDAYPPIQSIGNVNVNIMKRSEIPMILIVVIAGGIFLLTIAIFLIKNVK